MSSSNPELYILVYSADPTQESVLSTLRSGAMRFVGKREGSEVFLRELRKLCKRYEEECLTIGASRGRDENEKIIASIGMVGVSSQLATAVERVIQLRDKSGPVLLLGETGTGKEMIARALHHNRKGAFVAVNCADFLMSLDTARSEIFGHKKGAFTGANADHAGYFEQAKDGTLFLDEVYALPIECQIGLLRALQEKVVVPVGGTKEIRINCRIVAAAKPNLLQEVARGTFKPDLFYRIMKTIIHIPSLAERPDDIGPLVSMYCDSWGAENGGEKKHFLASTLPYLERYHWQGNAREVEHVVFTTLDSVPKPKIGIEDLRRLFPNIVTVSDKPSAPGSVFPLKAYVEEMERKHVLEVLHNSKSLRDGAKRLQVSHQKLLKVLQKNNLKTSDVVGKNRVNKAEG